jgi:hypothetical protein
MRYGRLQTVGDPFYGPVGQQGRSALFYNCVCDCGTTKVIRYDDLRSGRTLSCRCLIKEKSRTHGKSRTPIYKCWEAMLARTTNPNNTAYAQYAGRGISVCDRWSGPNGFANFYQDMGQRPSLGHSIERINNDGNYEPGNCRWATQKEQCRNTRKNVLISFQGRTQCISAWAEELGINTSTLYDRLVRRNWSIEKAFTTKTK